MVEVLKAGFFSTIQDLGRTGYQHYGVPYSGVMDTYSASLANLVLGNDTNSAVIEMTITGATLQFNCETYICITGADMSPKLNELPIKLYKGIKVRVGDIVSFGKLNNGFRTYLAVLGGFKTAFVMNSYSMYQGITTNFQLTKSDVLKIDVNNSYTSTKNALVKVKNNHLTSKLIAVFKGPEFDLLTKPQQDFLLQNDFSISKENNRMAYQLSEVLENNLAPIITSLVLPGTVQLTPSGKLIVLMRDCQTTGGYPRVLQLKESAINVLAQKFTGNVVRFTWV